MDIDEFVALSVKHNASNLHLCTGHLPMLRIDGELQAVESGEILTQQQMEAWCQAQLSKTMWQQLQQVGQLESGVSPCWWHPAARQFLFAEYRGFRGVTQDRQPVPHVGRTDHPGNYSGAAAARRWLDTRHRRYRQRQVDHVGGDDRLY